MTNDTTWNVWQDGIQAILITSLSNNPEELKVLQVESISQKFDVNVFIQGSINQSSSKVRINAQLIESKTEDIFKSFQIDGTERENLGHH